MYINLAVNDDPNYREIISQFRSILITMSRPSHIGEIENQTVERSFSSKGQITFPGEKVGTRLEV